MTTGVALNSSIAPVSSFSISSHFHSLFSKVDRVFGFYLTVVTCFCSYQAFRSYQYFMNPSSQLDDRLKVVKCNILLKDIQNRLEHDANADVTALLQECEALRKSITNTKKDPFVPENKVTISMELFECYLKKDPEQAYQIAQRFSSEAMLFDACQSLHQASPEFDLEKLFSLLNKAYKARIARTSQSSPLSEVKGVLKYVKLANSLGRDIEGSLERAMDFATKCEGGVVQADAWCEIAKVWKDLGYLESFWNTEQFTSFLEQAQNASKKAYIQDPDAFKAHLTLAKADLLCGIKNWAALDKANNIYYYYGVARTVWQDIDLFASLYTECGRADMAQEVLNKAFAALQEQNCISSVHDAKTYLGLANAFQKHGMQDEASKALACAIGVIEQLPDSTDKEIESKFDLLKQVSHCPEDLARKVIESLEQLYNKCSKKSIMKTEIARSIFRFCNEQKLIKKSEAFFETYLSDLTADSIQSAGDKIIKLTGSTLPLTPEQRILMLEAAEGFVPQVTSAQMTALIAEGYLDVNPAKSQELLDNYTKGQAWSHLLTAVVPAIALPVFHAYPMAYLSYRIAGLLFLAGSTILYMGPFSRT